MYVYCDVLENVPVGDTKAPLLRVMPVTGKNGDVSSICFDKPMYVPLQKKCFDTVEIDIRNEVGDPVPLEFGKSIITLHFWLSKIPYNLQ